jgi:hypothetical protein
MFITATQKNKYLLDLLSELYGGTVYTQQNSFKWTVYKKAYILSLLNYFKLYPSRSEKHNRIEAIKYYYEIKELKAHLALDNSILGNTWKNVLFKWNNWQKFDK